MRRLDHRAIGPGRAVPACPTASDRPGSNSRRRLRQKVQYAKSPIEVVVREHLYV
jgi:hypothetical protein